MGFTAAELAEMARADAEIEATFYVTNADVALGRLIDREAILDRMDPKQKRIAEAQRRYYEAHKEEIAEGKRELRDARIALGLTQREAAELLGVDQSTVCRWETIKPPPNWRTMIEKLTSQHKKRRRF
jgi:DNA-binding XRE family transcriptional regulator